MNMDERKAGFDAAVNELRIWADGFFGGAAPEYLRAAASDLERLRDAILLMPTKPEKEREQNV